MEVVDAVLSLRSLHVVSVVVHHTFEPHLSEVLAHGMVVFGQDLIYGTVLLGHGLALAEFVNVAELVVHPKPSGVLPGIQEVVIRLLHTFWHLGVVLDHVADWLAWSGEATLEVVAIHLVDVPVHMVLKE